jgi:thiosulfate/3-mercaptopyruvate sulfurtransferase
VQYLPDDLTQALLVRAGVDKNRLHLVYATGDTLPNDEVLSSSMVVYVLEKFGIENIRIVDGGLAEWKRGGLPPLRTISATPRASYPANAIPGSLLRSPTFRSTWASPGMCWSMPVH